MKRGLVFSLCAIAMAATATSAMAQANINVSLNLRYTDPANPAEGGTWNLVAKTDDVDGIAALVVYLNNAGTPGSSSINTGIGAMTLVGDPPGPALLVRETTKLEIVYAQDMTLANTMKLVGRGDGAGPNPAAPAEIAVDQFRNPTWNGASLIASGAWLGAARPEFTTVIGGPAPVAPRLSSGNTLPATIDGINPALLANVTTTVRGDSVSTDGLKPGDANRDGTVNSDDFNILAINFGGAGVKTWDTGDFNNSGTVTSDDFNALAINFGTSRVPPISAVPEPASIAMIGLAACGMLLARRRS